MAIRGMTIQNQHNADKGQRGPLWKDGGSGREVVCAWGDTSAVIFRALDGEFVWHVLNDERNGSCPSLAGAKEEAEAALAARMRRDDRDHGAGR